MKKENIKFFTGATLGLILAAAGIATASQAYFGGFGMGSISTDQREALEQAIENKDYSAYQTLTDELNKQHALTEEQFNDVSDRHVANEERRDALENAFANKDYNAWKEIMSNPPITSVITEDNFSRYAEMHILMEEGKYEEAQAIADELGLNKLGRGFGLGGRGGHMMGGMMGEFGEEGYRGSFGGRGRMGASSQ